MENRYGKLMERVPMPEGLEERVLQAARREGPPPRDFRRRALRGAVCAACALALVLGGVRLGTRDGGGAPSWSLGLTACAADTGTSYGAGDNAVLVFQEDLGMHWSAEGGYYTASRFQVEGDGIAEVALTLSRGELYRASAPAAAADGSFTLPVPERLGSSVSQAYDPEAVYGFWVPGAAAEDWQADPRAASRESLDALDGAVLTVEAVFDGGAVQTRRSTLSTGLLREETAADGTPVLQPTLAGDALAVHYGVCAADADATRLLEWPVAGADTVRLSAGYDGAALHDGIDIPAPAGTPVLAAADGTVAETGFDAERGNYLVLDHGGGLQTVYGQCREILVQAGDAVSAGEQAAVLGNTGMSTGAHLHFQVLLDGEPQNPLAYFDAALRRALQAV